MFRWAPLGEPETTAGLCTSAEFRLPTEVGQRRPSPRCARLSQSPTACDSASLAQRGSLGKPQRAAAALWQRSLHPTVGPGSRGRAGERECLLRGYDAYLVEVGAQPHVVGRDADGRRALTETGGFQHALARRATPPTTTTTTTTRTTTRRTARPATQSTQWQRRKEAPLMLRRWMPKRWTQHNRARHRSPAVGDASRARLFSAPPTTPSGRQPRNMRESHRAVDVVSTGQRRP